jgi:hypothetical protein
MRPRIDICLVFFFIVSIVLPGCGRLMGTVSVTPLDSGEIEAKALLGSIARLNETLKTFKGIGSVNLSNRKGALRSARVAWVGTDNGNVRIEVLGVSGQPVASFATDGEWLYLYLRSEGRFYKKRINGAASLDPLLSIPIKADDVMAFIAGRVPVREHAQATVTRDLNGDGYVLILRNRWARHVEKIYLDHAKERIWKVEIFDPAGAVSFRVILEDFRMIESYRVPTRLSISDDKGMNAMLVVEKYWTNIQVLSTMFELSKPEK